MFDPYHKWMGIPKGPRPPTHYQLLGIMPTETDAEAIKEAALRQTAQVRVNQTGPHSELCTRVLNEIAQARAVLLNLKLRREYDQRIAAPPPQIEMPALPEDVAVESSAPEPPSPAAVRRLPHINGAALIAALAYVLVLLVGGAASFWLTYDGLHSAAQAAPKTRPGAAPRDKAR
jgi:hypothetical protein